MQRAWPHNSAEPGTRLPAWVVSMLLHGGLFFALALAVDQAPRGAMEEPIRSAGIVLKRASAAGALYEGEDATAQESTFADSPQPQESVAVQSTITEQAGDEGDAVTAEQVMPDAAPAESNGGAERLSSQPRRTTGARLGSPAGGGRYAKVSVFGVEGTGNKFVYVFDRSSSMEGALLAAAKRQLVESLNSLDSVHQFHIIFFNHRLRLFDMTAGSRRIAFGTDRNKKLAANFVGGITADGGTDRFAALKQALAFQPDVVFFLTDADDPMSASEMADLERIYSRLGTAICVIEFGRSAAPPQRNFLTELAALSGGQYGYVDTAKLKP